MKPIAHRLTPKAYFDPFFFNVFMSEWKLDVVITYFEHWVKFLLEQGIHAPADFKDELCRQIKNTPAQPYPRLILKLPMLLTNNGTCDFELEFYGGVLPSCSGGFVLAKSIPFDETALARVLDSGLAEVVIYPVVGKYEICLIGPAWALYAHFKDRDWNRRSWAGVIGPPEVGRNALTALAARFGQERLSFTFPSEVKQINKWLAKCDSEMGPQVEESLARLLALNDSSVRAWRKTHV